MTIFVQCILCWYFCLIVYSFIDSFKIEPPAPAKTKEKDIWKHPLIVEAGLKKPLEEIDLEEASAADIGRLLVNEFDSPEDK